MHYAILALFTMQFYLPWPYSQCNNRSTVTSPFMINTLRFERRYGWIYKTTNINHSVALQLAFPIFDAQDQQPQT